MKNLTNREVQRISEVNYHLKRMSFGDRVQHMINVLNEANAAIDAIENEIQEGTPINASKASETLTLTGVVVHGESVTINNPDKEGADTYEFLADAAQVLSVGTIPVDIEADTTKSSINLAIAAQPVSEDTMTIGVGDGIKEYIFVPNTTASGEGQIDVGTDLPTAQANIIAAINGTDGHNTPHTQVSIGDFEANVAIVTALVGGVAGDAIETTETFESVANEFSGATLAGGADCSAVDAIVALLLAVGVADTQDVTAEDGEGPTVIFTSVVGGVIGNAIEVDSNMTNGAFGDIQMSGGVDGTVAVIGDVKFDNTYLYVAIEDNTIHDTNWRRIALGSAY
jgi:hypothetical protein